MPALPEILVLALLSEVPLPGTQPNELTLPPEPSSTCACHDAFNADAITEPGESYRATMMALSGRDPLFRAALQVSFNDRPELSDLCLRCHVPVAWLNGRSEPADGSLIQVEDLESVTCDMCHRAVPADPALVGDGQFTISPSTAKRAPRGSAPFGGHNVVTDSYVSNPDMCGLCHSLFNPAENAHDANDTDLGIHYYEQRTYEEWKDSVFPSQDKTCITCHMTRTTGAAVRGGDSYDNLAVHNFVAGNTFAVQAVQLLNPTLGISGITSEVGRWVDQQLHSAASLEITQTEPASLMLESGEEFSVSVRMTNKTGHKLPTGYPEGRRIYLEVRLSLDGQAPQILSGAWDQQSGKVVRDPQIRTYETEHGRVENGVGARIHHLILMNQIISDTRIPPEGFTPTYPDMVPQARDYGGGAPYQHWDDHTYTFTAPEVTGTITGTITVRAMYQSTDGDVVAFLLNQTQDKPEHDQLAMVWEGLGHAPPKEMVRTSVPIVVTERVAEPDAGVTDQDAASASPDGGGFKIEDGGCSCVAAVPVEHDLAPLALLALLLALRLHTWRPRSKANGLQTSRTTLPERRSGAAHLG